MAYMRLIALLVLAGCTPTANAVIDAGEVVVEKKVDAAIERGINRVCKGPVDVMIRSAETYPALIPFVVESCPDTYGRLRDMMVTDGMIILSPEDLTALKALLANQQ